MTHPYSRRAILLTGVGAATLGHLPGPASANYVSSTDGFAYEVTRTETEWRALLDEKSYLIMREGQTEAPKSHPLWNNTDPGIYFCKGCDLPVYDARWKVVVDKGWLFYKHGIENALLMGVDWPEGAERTPEIEFLVAIETHCRRCGSHMGHIVLLGDQLLHCINGASMNFAPAET